MGVVVLSAFACGKSDDVPVDDAGLETDAGADAAIPSPDAPDAGSKPDAEKPFEPSVTSDGLPACPKLDDCKEGTTPFSLLYEAPANIEFREGPTNGLLAYDTEAHRFVAYRVHQESMNGHQLTVDEQFRFDARYDRVHVDPAGEVLACEGASCDLRDLTGDSLLAHVPAELHATSFDRRCVAGTGLACLEDSKQTWIWYLRPEALERPITTFAYLGGAAFVASDGQGHVFVVDQGRIFPLDLGTTEPVVSLSSGWHISLQHWAGRTASGKLILGSYGGGTICDATVDLAFVDFMIGFVVKRGDMLAGGSMECGRTTLPPTATGLGVVACGISAAVFAFDAHHVYGRPFQCLVD